MENIEDQAQDVNSGEIATSSDSSTAEQTTSQAQSDETANGDGKYVPYDRFKEVNEGYKQSLARLEELESAMREFKSSSQPVPEVDPQQLALKEQLRALGFVTREEQLAEIKRQKEDIEVQQELGRLEKTYDGSDGRPKFDRKSVVKFAIEKGLGDLEVAYKVQNEASLIDWHIKQASSKTKGTKSEASDGSGSAVAGTSNSDLKEAAKRGDRSSLKTLIGRIAKQVSN